MHTFGRPTLRLAALLVVSAGTLLTGCSSSDDRRASPGSFTTDAWRREMNPEMTAIITKLESLGGKPIESLTPAEARKQPTPVDAVTAIMRDKGKPTAPPPGPAPSVQVASRSVRGPEGLSVPVRVYTPTNATENNAVVPTIVYVHGGGWVLASPEVYDGSARALADKCNAVVVSVDYRKAPEHKFPAAHEDVYAVLQHALSGEASFGGDPNRVAIAGESAGGNMATAACIMAAQRGGRMPVHQLLVYPVSNHAFDTPSYRENARAKPLNAPMMPWFFGHYLRSPADGNSPLISPLRASESDLSKLPEATIILAEIDPLRSEGMMYAQRLKAAGVEVSSKNYEGVTHEFFGMAAVLAEARSAQAFAVDRLQSAFENARPAPAAGTLPRTDRPTGTQPINW